VRKLCGRLTCYGVTRGSHIRQPFCVPQPASAIEGAERNKDHPTTCEDLPLPLAHVGDKKVKRFHFSEITGRLPYVRATVTQLMRKLVFCNSGLDSRLPFGGFHEVHAHEVYARVHAHEVHAVRYAFMKYTPMRCRPVRCRPVRCTFVRYTPIDAGL
jgi:hypothetical protein